MGALIVFGTVLIIWFMATWCFKDHMEDEEELLRNHRNKK